MASDQHHVVYHGDGITGGPEWQKKVDAEIGSRPTAVLKRTPMTPALLELHRQRGAAARAVPYSAAEVSRLDDLITLEHKR